METYIQRNMDDVDISIMFVRNKYGNEYQVRT